MKHYFTTTEQFKMLMRELGVEVEHAKVGRQVRNQKGTGIRSDYLIFSVRELQAQLKQARKEARLPMSHYLGQYDHSISNGLSVTQLNQLRELHCVEEGCYKLINFLYLRCVNILNTPRKMYNNV